MSEDSTFEYAQVQRVSVLLDLKRYTEASREAAKALSSCPDSFSLQHLMAYAMLMTDDIAEADRLNRLAIATEPSNGSGYYLRSLILHEQLNFTGELEMAQKAAAIDPHCADYLGRLVEAQLQSGDVRSAKACAQQLVHLTPGSEEAHEQLARICMQLSEWKSAEEHYRAVLSINPTQTHIHRNLAYTLGEQKRKREAIDVLFSALKLDPANTDLQKEVYEAVHSYLPMRLFYRRRQSELQALPSSLAAFYADRRQRSLFYEKYSAWLNVLVWAALLGGLAFLFR